MKSKFKIGDKVLPTKKCLKNQADVFINNKPKQIKYMVYNSFLKRNEYFLDLLGRTGVFYSYELEKAK